MTKAQDVMAAVNKVLKTDALHMASEDRFDVSLMPTNMLPIDILLDGGIARGRITTFYGDFSSGKSLIALYTIMRCQKDGGVAALFDTEQAFDPEWARTIGVDPDELILIQEDQMGEKALDQAEALIRSGEIDLLVIDSVTGMVPAAQYSAALEGGLQPGRHAAMMSRALPKLVTANRKTAILLISQTRQNIGITFGPKENVSGGRALGYYSSVMVQMRKRGMVTEDATSHDGDGWQKTHRVVGQKYKAELNKSKLSRPFQEVLFDWNLFDNAIDVPKFVIAQGLELGYIKQSGSWATFEPIDADGVIGEPIKAQGLAKLESVLRDNGGLEVLTRMVSTHYGLRDIYAA